MKKHTKGITAIAVVLLMFFTMLSFPARVKASARGGEVILSNHVIAEYMITKTIDLSESDIDITVPQADRDALYAEAKESAYLWLYYTMLLRGISGEEHPGLEELVQKYKLYNKYWQEELSLSPDDFTLTEKAKTALQAITDAGDIDGVLANISNEDLSEWFDEENGNGDAIIRGKIEEIYNDKFSDYITPALAEALPVTAHFSLKPLAEDGSEDDAAGVDGNTVKRGKMGEVAEGSVNFGAAGQFYDAILAEYMYAQDVSDPNSFPVGPTYTEDDPEPTDVLKDNRDVGMHVFSILGGALFSSDDSQLALSFRRGTPQYPGIHALLERGDSLATYAWAAFSVSAPGKYTQTFNLHLNPVVTYIYDNLTYTDYSFTPAESGNYYEVRYKQESERPATDLITDITFDDSGRVLSVSKPIEIKTGLWDIIDNNQEVGTYRFKLVETDIDGEVEGNRFTAEEDVVYLDYVVQETTDDYGRPTLHFYFKRTDFKNILKEAPDLTVKKVWEDADDKDGIRPASVDVTLNKVEGDNAVAVETVTLNKENGWTHTWTDLEPDTEYTVEETKTDVITGTDGEKTYAVQVEGSMEEGFTITNTHTPKPEEPKPEEPKPEEPKPEEPKTDVPKTPEKPAERHPALATTVKAGGQTASASAPAQLLFEDTKEPVTVVDTIAYTDLIDGATYTVTGTLMRIDLDGTETAVATVTEDLVAEGENGTWDMTFRDVSLINYAKYVVFEEAYSEADSKASKENPLTHKDRNDQAQTILTEDENGIVLGDYEEPVFNGTLSTVVSAAGKKASAEKELVLTVAEAKGSSISDTITYKGLASGDSYEVTGRIFKVKDGKIAEEIGTVTKELKAEEGGSGTWEMTFEKLPLAEADSYIVFEVAANQHPNKQKDEAAHQDIKDKAQTIYVAPDSKKAEPVKNDTKKAAAPKTGDPSMPAVWAGLLIGAGVLAVYAGRKRIKK